MNGTISVIDGASNSIVADVPIAPFPSALAVNAATNFALGMAAAAAGGASSGGHSSECCPTSDDQQSAIQESELDDQRRKINSLQNELDDITNRHPGL